MRLFIVTILVASVIFSCSKEKKTAKALEGSWKVISFINNGQIDPIDFTNSFFNFDYCAPKKTNGCPGSWNGKLSNGNDFDFDFIFKVNDENDVSLEFDSVDVDTLFNAFLNTDIKITVDTLELEFISGQEFFEFIMLKNS